MRSVYDSKAVKTLFATYWSSSGWRNESDRIVAPDDFEYALSRGVMFHPAERRHDDVIPELRQVAARIRPESVGSAFLYSLTTRDLAYRSALGSYSTAAWMPAHKHSGAGRCSICGEYDRLGMREDLNVLNFERLKWGGIRHDNPIYQLFDLTQFEKLPAVEATKEDCEILQSILAAALSLPADAWCRDLEKSISRFFPSSKSERESLLHILSYSGTIAPRERPGFFRDWPTIVQREQRPTGKIDWTYPIMWWYGRHGVNYEAVDHYFPTLRKRSHARPLSISSSNEIES